MQVHRAKAAEAQPVLLKLLESTERLVREGVMLALVQVATIPCAECTKRFDDVISAQGNQERLENLTKDTMVVRDYFAGAASTPAK